MRVGGDITGAVDSIIGRESIMYDVIVIGCGIVGAATAYELSKYQLKTLILEAEK